MWSMCILNVVCSMVERCNCSFNASYIVYQSSTFWNQTNPSLFLQIYSYSHTHSHTPKQNTNTLHNRWAIQDLAAPAPKYTTTASEIAMPPTSSTWTIPTSSKSGISSLSNTIVTKADCHSYPPNMSIPAWDWNVCAVYYRINRVIMILMHSHPSLTRLRNCPLWDPTRENWGRRIRH